MGLIGSTPCGVNWISLFLHSSICMIINIIVIYIEMVRTYIKKTDHGSWCAEKMREAVIKVKSKEMTTRQAAEIYDVPYTSLQRRVILRNV